VLALRFSRLPLLGRLSVGQCDQERLAVDVERVCLLSEPTPNPGAAMVTDKFLCAAALYQYRALRSLTAAGYQPHDPRGLLMRPWIGACITTTNLFRNQTTSLIT